MNYKRLYDDIIYNAKTQSRSKCLGTYYERHHIIPRCMNGTNDKENLVLLTAREHYIAHKLLHKIYPEDKGLLTALFMLSNTLNEQRNYKITSKEYERLRIDYAESLKNNIPWNKDKKLKPLSDDHKSKISKRFKGIKRGPMKQSTKDKLSVLNKGIKKPDYFKEKCKTRFALNNPMKGKTGKLNHLYGTKYINKNGVSKRVPVDELGDWINSGWKLGRI